MFSIGFNTIRVEQLFMEAHMPIRRTIVTVVPALDRAKHENSLYFANPVDRRCDRLRVVMAWYSGAPVYFWNTSRHSTRFIRIS